MRIVITGITGATEYPPENAAGAATRFAGFRQTVFPAA
jgi:hypothetical protein